MVVILGGTTWDGIWMSERYLATELSSSVPVLWVDAPTPWPVSRTSGGMRRTAAVRGVRLVAPGIARLSPVTVPGVSRPGLRAVARAATRAAVRGVVRRSGVTVLGVLVATVEAPHDTLRGVGQTFYVTDDFTAGADLMGLDARWLEGRQRLHAATARHVVAASPALRDGWVGSRPDVVMIPNGCRLPDGTSGGTPPDVVLPRPIAGVVGQLSDRLDLACLEAVADQGVSLLLVGPDRGLTERDRFQALVSRPTVQWVGEKPQHEVADYLAVMDVGLVPYRTDRFNLASFPLKMLEYLAAGVPVVSTDLPASRWLDTPLVGIGSDAGQFAARTTRTLAAPADAAACRRFAAGHTWQQRATQLAPLLGVPDRRAVTVSGSTGGGRP